MLEVLRPVIRGRRGPNARGKGGELLTNSYSSPLSTLHCTEMHRTVHCTVFNEVHCTVQGSACLQWNDEVVVWWSFIGEAGRVYRLQKYTAMLLTLR